MCLIIAPGKDGKPALLPEDAFKYAFNRNSDGFGAMWTEDGRVQHIKHLGLEKDEAYELMQSLTEEHPDVIFHLRLKTHGRVIPSLCHPFRVLHKNRHGKDLFFMHNGVLSSFGDKLTYGQSDTTAFKDKVLVPLLTRNPDALEDPAILEGLNKMTSGNRLIFLDSDGKVYRTSESTWNNRYDLTLSNTYMLPSLPYKGPLAGNYSAGGSSNVTEIGAPTPKEGYPIFRRVKWTSGGVTGCWFKEVCPGLIRSEYGTLYRDRGVNVELDAQIDRVLQKDELNVMLDQQDRNEREGRTSSATYIPSEDDLNDDLPFEGGIPRRSGGPAPEGERLRYARIVHNCHDATVESREHMLADLLSMGNTEMFSFIKEDPDNANVIMSELIEIIIEMNDLCMDEEGEIIFDYDTLTDMGSDEHHQQSMKEISDKRRERYSVLAEAVAELEEAQRRDEEDTYIKPTKKTKQKKAA